MTIRLKKYLLTGLMIGGLSAFYACQKDNSNSGGVPFVSTTYGGADLSTLPKIAENKAMMQSFYWDVKPVGEWWNTLAAKAEDWSQHGIDKVWLPVISKGASGENSMGYDPYDYFDFGEYDQKGSVETRFGSRKELENLISVIHLNQMKVIADIVLGHNSGGNLEYHPIRKGSFYTKFSPLSGKFKRTWEDFHPNDRHTSDEGALFFEGTDLCHLQPNVQNWFWLYKDSSLAQYYNTTMKIDGWRFDYVKSFSPTYIREFMNVVPNTWAVGECWDGSVNVVSTWANQSEVNAFDFPNFYAMKLAFNYNDLTYLQSQPAYFKSYPDKAVTFVSNHDTEKDPDPKNKIANKYLAYAYLLSLPGYPCIFYSDYEGGYIKSIQRLMDIRQAFAVGDFSILYYSKEEFILMRAGSDNNPGMIVYLNVSDNIKQQTITTRWKNKEIADYAGMPTTNKVVTDANGQVSISAPSKGYSIWSLATVN